MRPSNVICTEFYDIKKFTWKGKHGISEASSLSRGKLFCSVYNDACDEGFGITGNQREVVFAVDRIERDRDNDIVSWHLKSISEKGFTLKVFND